MAPPKNTKPLRLDSLASKPASWRQVMRLVITCLFSLVMKGELCRKKAGRMIRILSGCGRDQIIERGEPNSRCHSICVTSKHEDRASNLWHEAEFTLCSVEIFERRLLPRL
jgi:hypothetical protein